jgi:hypothetical protein
MVSFGLLTEIKLNGQFGPGDLAPAGSAEQIEVEVNVLGPAWTGVRHVELFANGVKVREVDVADKLQPAGTKWHGQWTLERPKHDVFLVAIAEGPGISEAYWPTAKPYQKTSIQWKPYVMGASGAVFVDADGSGGFDSAYAVASKIVESANAELKAVVGRLSECDEAVAAEAASILRVRMGDGFEAKLTAAAEGGGPAVKRGFRAYLRAWAESREAQKTVKLDAKNGPTP